MRNGIAWLINLWGKKRAYSACKAWQAVLNLQSPEVQTILYDLAIYCNIYKTSFSSKDSHATAFNEGARDVFLHIMEMLNLDLSDLHNIVEEVQKSQ